MLVQWGIETAQKNGVNLAPFDHVVVYMNYGVDSGFAGNGVVLHHEDANTCEVGFTCHELGHGYGLPHSWAANPDIEYGDGWDLMSWQTTTFNWQINYSGATGLATVGLNARNLDALGALPAARVWSPSAPDFSEQVLLDPLCQIPLGLANRLAALLPASGTRPARPSGSEYYVEYRARAGWDQAIPQDSITVRERRVTTTDDSYLVPSSFSSLVAGQTFETPAPKVFVHVSAIDQANHVATVHVWDLPDGSLRKEESRPAVYLISEGAKVWVESPGVLLGKTWADVRIVPDGGLSTVPDGHAFVPFWRSGRVFPGDYAAGTVVAYEPGTHDWFLGAVKGGGLAWVPIGNTAGFGNLADGRPFWTGDFTGSGHTEVLFYYPGDGNWWLGTITGTTLNWGLVGNTKGFGNTSHYPTWIGAFSGPGRSEVLFYSPGDHNWWLGTITGTTLNWTLVGNTAGFGNLADGRPFWTGDFTGSGHTEVLFYYPGDGNWWLGTITGTTLNWGLVGNTKGFGNTSHYPTWIGAFSGPGRSEVLFYSPGDHNWWLGTITGTTLNWTLVGNTAGFGNLADGRPFWTGDFTGSGHTEVLFYYPGDGNWWLGTITGTTLNWGLVGNTKGFGNTSHYPTWIGAFSGPGRSEVLFYSPGDHNWWLGTITGTTLNWTLVRRGVGPAP